MRGWMYGTGTFDASDGHDRHDTGLCPPALAAYISALISTATRTNPVIPVSLQH
jgi:hypothetical protein